jgi:hypothetical protein
MEREPQTVGLRLEQAAPNCMHRNTVRIGI